MRVRWGAGLGLLTVLLAPGTAAAHGLVGRADLPLPGSMFILGAGVVLFVSFVALALLWPEPRLQAPDPPPPEGPVGPGVRALEVLCGAIGVGLLGLTVYAGLEGPAAANKNFASTFIFVIFWVGLLPLSVLFGDVLAPFNPWRAIGRATGWLVRRLTPGAAVEPLAYPARLGYWPAVAGLFAFAWLELAVVGGNRPEVTAKAALVYTAAQCVGMGLYGAEPWSRRGEGFGVFFGLISRLAPLQWCRGRPQLGLPLRRAGAWPTLPGTTALIAVVIGGVTFDGVSQGPLFGELEPPLSEFWLDVGFNGAHADQLAFGTVLVACILVIGGFYTAGTAAARRAGPSLDAGALRRAFAHSLAPIALAYAGAHYLSLLVYSGQSFWGLLSDPLGTGADLLGTAPPSIDYTVISATQIWWAQLALVVGGHVAALCLAHDRALALYPDKRQAVRSQYWMLGVMVGFTTLALWLLHTIDTSGG